MKTVVPFLPKSIAERLEQIPSFQQNEIEEIRVRINRPLEVTMKGSPLFLPYTVQPEDALHLLNKISGYSIYTLEEELKRGYITISGGHRVGLAGKVILENSQVKAIRIFRPLISELHGKELELRIPSFLSYLIMVGSIQ